MKAFNIDGQWRNPGSELYDLKNDSPRAFEPFDENEKVESVGVAQEEMSWNPTTYLSIGTSKSSYCITQRGYFGRSPMPPQAGDKICVFYGGKVPFLLRPQAKSGHFKLAGEIYIHGIMKGAAMNTMEDKAKDFVLV
ncbi:hypothetical protein FJTKL_01427 [Diaporthe vaccinii]|uniref:Uncharacterized protein n=1 Tax=Diaporthe vaccinii TaxID=105482 RepID=A0ABR4E0U6_9PEZI